MAIVFAIVGYQLEWQSMWFASGLSVGLSAFNLLGWLTEVVDEARLTINEYGFHYVKGKRYRLVSDDND